MFQASASPANRKVRTETSCSAGARSRPTKAAQPANSTISNQEMRPRGGSGARCGGPGRLAAIALLARADRGRTLLAEQAVGPEDHRQQEQQEEEQLPKGRRDVVAAQRLHHTDAHAAYERALDAAHAAQHDDDEGD